MSGTFTFDKENPASPDTSIDALRLKPRTYNLLYRAPLVVRTIGDLAGRTGLELRRLPHPFRDADLDDLNARLQIFGYGPITPDQGITLPTAQQE